MSLDIFVQLDVVGEGQNTTAVWRDHRNTVRTANDVVDQLVVIILTSILNRGPPRGGRCVWTDSPSCFPLPHPAGTGRGWTRLGRCGRSSMPSSPRSRHLTR